MCADQPATRAAVNIGVNSSGGTCALSSTTADQNSTFVASTRSGLRLQLLERRPLERLRASNAREPISRLVRRSTRARGSSARYTRWPKPISRSPRSSSCFT